MHFEIYLYLREQRFEDILLEFYLCVCDVLVQSKHFLRLVVPERDSVEDSLSEVGPFLLEFLALGFFPVGDLILRIKIQIDGGTEPTKDGQVSGGIKEGLELRECLKLCSSLYLCWEL